VESSKSKDQLDAPKPKADSKTYKIIAFPADKEFKLHCYIYTKKSPNKKKHRREKHNSKSYSECLHIVLDRASKQQNLAVEKAAMLKFKLQTAIEQADFKHEFNMLEAVKSLKCVTHLQHSKTYEGKSHKEMCNKGLLFLDHCGLDLQQFMQSSFDALSNSNKCSLFESMLQALIELNGNQILHNDLTPPNILVNSLQAVFADFEFAVSLKDCPDETFNAFVLKKGTPALISPERLDYIYAKGESKKPGLPGNVWGIGCIMFYMLQKSWPEICHQIFNYYNVLREIENLSKLFEVPKAKEKMQALSDQEKESWNRLKFTLKQMKAYVDEDSSKEGIFKLITELLHPDPEKRLTAEDALKKFQALNGDIFVDVPDDYQQYFSETAYASYLAEERSK
jgi:serine/threonine protein kinase